ncbi:MAG: alpha/beta fold hydrolase [Steroidobacteraceae bacterium]
MAKSTPRTAGAGRPAPRLRRAYHDCRHGQLHLHNAIPAGGGFDELTSVICVHGAGETGRAFAPLLAPLGAERSVYAPDLPGSGESDPAPGVPFVEAGAQAILDFAESMRIRRFDLVAQGEGAAIAKRVAAERPDAVRRLVALGEAGQPRAGDVAALLKQLS